MFVQVFQGQVKDRALWADQTEVWRREIKPKTTGFLGFTTGVTADGYMVTVVRFDSEEKARVDSALAEQGAWFEKTSAAFAGEIIFHDCSEVDTLFNGAAGDAAFVQVMQGRAKGQEQMRAEMRRMEGALHEVRPDLLGAVIGWHGDGGFTQAAYFSSQEEARMNEQAMANSPVYAQFTSLIDGDLTFYDFNEPGSD
jgi:hypothetical protein